MSKEYFPKLYIITNLWKCISTTASQFLTQNVACTPSDLRVFMNIETLAAGLWLSLLPIGKYELGLMNPNFETKDSSVRNVEKAKSTNMTDSNLDKTQKSEVKFKIIKKERLE